MPYVLRLGQVCVLVAAGAAATTAAKPVSDTDLANLWQQGNLNQLERLAETGDLRAQRWAALMLHNRGEYDEAIQWYRRAVDQGDGYAASQIAFFYEHGVGRAKDMREALSWHRTGAALHHANSQIRYATALREGAVIARNEQEAFRWFARAARQARNSAQLGYAYLPLAEMYKDGVGTPRDLRRAYALARAAEHTVDDSDTVSQRRAESIQTTIAARLPRSELDAAEQLFTASWPDLAARQGSGPASWVAAFVLLAIGAAGMLVWRRRTRSDHVRSA